ncbi:hypothetical protein MANES_04G075650v8 [Manihot esculenta]|uniref:Uncharacterized protein n=1 Tax=Manihot esculenta TaxID=3983 RepID=A0ACB7HV52_MANES|nr:hypothetical protein MANES_04G075650v8 [Manihot esculenta]
MLNLRLLMTLLSSLCLLLTLIILMGSLILLFLLQQTVSSPIASSHLSPKHQPLSNLCFATPPYHQSFVQNIANVPETSTYAQTSLDAKLVAAAQQEQLALKKKIFGCLQKLRNDN